MSHFDFLIFLFFTHYCTKTAYIRACFFCLLFFSTVMFLLVLCLGLLFICPSMGKTKQRDAVVAFDLEATVAPTQSGISSSLLAMVCH